MDRRRHSVQVIQQSPESSDPLRALSVFAINSHGQGVGDNPSPSQKGTIDAYDGRLPTAGQ
jgi:hypothetical protein